MRILGLDLGTNSIGWALIEQSHSNNTDNPIGKIIDAGSRIIPMSQDILGKFDSGQSISQTAERTKFRSTRRLRERHLLRRERLHRVLNILGFLPTHYANRIDFDKKLGQFLPEEEPKLAYFFDNEKNTFDFLFKQSFAEMLLDFAQHQPQLVDGGKKIPYDWTIYYLRKQALNKKIEKEELAWLILNFNQKRGYYQLRGEEEDEKPNQSVELVSLLVTDITTTGDKKPNGDIWYNIILENGWVYKRSSKIPLDWKGKVKDFIVTTDLNEDGSIKKDKSGNEKRSFRAPGEDDWTLQKKKTEKAIDISHKHVGEFIYDNLLKDPSQKVRGKLVRVIERKFYRREFEAILKKQKEFHPELNDPVLYNSCVEELYKNNENHRNSLGKRDVVYLFLNDIIFYQRPLKSKKSSIGACKFEKQTFLKNGAKKDLPLTGIAVSHPLFQEFRLWQFIQNLRIYQKERTIDGELQMDVDVTNEFLKSPEDKVSLFEWLNGRKEVDQNSFLRYPGFNLRKDTANYRWNYLEDKLYPCNETKTLILARLNKTPNIKQGFLTREREEAIWHLLYSTDDKNALEKSLATFAEKQGLDEQFVENFRKTPPFAKKYGAYSAKAIKKLLPLMRMGKYWDENDIDANTKDRIEKLLNAEFDENIRDRVRDKSIHLTQENDFSGLPLWLAEYVVYDRHAEVEASKNWKTASDISPLPQHSLRNPIVEQIVNETLQVVKDIWVRHGKGMEGFFDEIHIELGREMKNPADKRKQLTETISKNENTNLRIKSLLSEMLSDGGIENVRPYSPMQQEILKIYEEGALNAVENIPEEILSISKQAQPTKSELTRYKLWLDQKYRSPYTGEMIPLGKLFTPAYEIEHIIPQSRYFDDSFSNKVICEAIVNGEKYKANRTAFEFIKEFGGAEVKELSNGTKKVNVLTIPAYERLVKDDFAKNRGKLKRLLMEDIPDDFIKRQINDSRYISKVVKNILSNIVRDKDEQEVTSKKVISSTGGITSTLKQDWGLNDIWNEIIAPRFKELNNKTKSNNYGDINPNTNKFLPQVPLVESQKGFNKKRIDHRHHMLDAIVIACASRNHINYLNNEFALGKETKEDKQKKRYDLRSKLCEKIYTDSGGNYQWRFKKPWASFTQDTKEQLYNTVVSFKQNLRVVNKTKNRYNVWEKQSNGESKKASVPQTKGEQLAIRKPLHKDTVSGLVKLQFKKTVSLSVALDDWKMIVDRDLRAKIKELVTQYHYDKKKLQKYFKDKNNLWKDKDISRLDIYYWDNDNVASRVRVDESFGSKKIASITDTGIQKIMLNHLKRFDELKNGKITEHPELAFSVDGIDTLNKDIAILNDGKPHQPIYKVRTFEPKGNKFEVGQTGNKKKKYVEAAKGTNLFFAVYKIDNGKRICETVPLNIVIERQKQGLPPVPEVSVGGHRLLFYLSPDDSVYVPNIEEQHNEVSIDFEKLSRDQLTRIYKVVSFYNNRLYCIPNYVAVSIVDKVEFTQLNKLEFVDGTSIKDVCIKLKQDRLGALSPLT